jgi:neurotrimin
MSSEAPRILDSISTSDTTIKEGDMLQMKCNASGRPTPTIMWRREGNAILPGGGVRKMASCLPKHFIIKLCIDPYTCTTQGGELDITNTQYTARGRYMCEAFNEVGYDRRDIVLTVQREFSLRVQCLNSKGLPFSTDAPKLFQDPARTGQAIGYQRTLICHVDANPVPSTEEENNQLYWSYNAIRISEDDRWVACPYLTQEGLQSLHLACISYNLIDDSSA